ncbi:hypothetical protein M0805_008137 [Coniferiporia weirii]|nr:hypothetical protein M0805_008137 [Coniferiporia weirii]
MGVAASPDLANLYGWHFEQKNNVHNDPLIPFYGHYIDDCLAMAYADTLEEALALVSNKIKFDGCEITWSASDKYQVFLDMVVYKDNNNALQYMPYRKVQSHQERIPWISHHPIDVKKGTFIGEMSRMAVLSSKFATYQEAVQSLVALYIRRGYPANLVNSWRKINLKSRWESRLITKSVVDRERTPVLALKSVFNPAWNYFNARELQDNMFGYWREWLARAARGNFNNEFPKPSDNDISPLNVDTAATMWSSSIDNNGNIIHYPDVSKTNILDGRVLVSRKRTKNLYDAANLWKFSILSKLEEGITEDLVQNLGLKSLETERLVPAEIAGFNEEQLGESTRLPSGNIVSNADEDIVLHQRSPSPPVGKGWY